MAALTNGLKIICNEPKSYVFKNYSSLIHKLQYQQLCESKDKCLNAIISCYNAYLSKYVKNSFSLWSSSDCKYAAGQKRLTARNKSLDADTVVVKYNYKRLDSFFCSLRNNARFKLYQATGNGRNVQFSVVPKHIKSVLSMIEVINSNYKSNFMTPKHTICKKRSKVLQRKYSLSGQKNKQNKGFINKNKIPPLSAFTEMKNLNNIKFVDLSNPVLHTIDVRDRKIKRKSIINLIQKTNDLHELKHETKECFGENNINGDIVCNKTIRSLEQIKKNNSKNIYAIKETSNKHNRNTNLSLKNENNKFFISPYSVPIFGRNRFNDLHWFTPDTYLQKDRILNCQCRNVMCCNSTNQKSKRMAHVWNSARNTHSTGNGFCQDVGKIKFISSLKDKMLTIQSRFKFKLVDLKQNDEISMKNESPDKNYSINVVLNFDNSLFKENKIDGSLAQSKPGTDHNKLINVNETSLRESKHNTDKQTRVSEDPTDELKTGYDHNELMPKPGHPSSNEGNKDTNCDKVEKYFDDVWHDVVLGKYENKWLKTLMQLKTCSACVKEFGENSALNENECEEDDLEKEGLALKPVVHCNDDQDIPVNTGIYSIYRDAKNAKINETVIMSVFSNHDSLSNKEGSTSETIGEDEHLNHEQKTESGSSKQQTDTINEKIENTLNIVQVNTDSDVNIPPLKSIDKNSFLKQKQISHVKTGHAVDDIQEEKQDTNVELKTNISEGIKNPQESAYKNECLKSKTQSTKQDNKEYGASSANTNKKYHGMLDVNDENTMSQNEFVSSELQSFKYNTDSSCKEKKNLLEIKGSKGDILTETAVDKDSFINRKKQGLESHELKENLLSQIETNITCDMNVPVVKSIDTDASLVCKTDDKGDQHGYVKQKLIPVEQKSHFKESTEPQVNLDDNVRSDSIINNLCVQNSNDVSTASCENSVDKIVDVKHKKEPKPGSPVCGINYTTKGEQNTLAKSSTKSVNEQRTTCHEQAFGKDDLNHSSLKDRNNNTEGESKYFFSKSNKLASTTNDVPTCNASMEKIYKQSELINPQRGWIPIVGKLWDLSNKHNLYKMLDIICKNDSICTWLNLNNNKIKKYTTGKIDEINCDSDSNTICIPKKNKWNGMKVKREKSMNCEKGWIKDGVQKLWGFSNKYKNMKNTEDSASNWYSKVKKGNKNTYNSNNSNKGNTNNNKVNFVKNTLVKNRKQKDNEEKQNKFMNCRDEWVVGVEKLWRSSNPNESSESVNWIPTSSMNSSKEDLINVKINDKKSYIQNKKFFNEIPKKIDDIHNNRTAPGNKSVRNKLMTYKHPNELKRTVYLKSNAGVSSIRKNKILYDVQIRSSADTDKVQGSKLKSLMQLKQCNGIHLRKALMWEMNNMKTLIPDKGFSQKNKVKLNSYSTFHSKSCKDNKNIKSYDNSYMSKLQIPEDKHCTSEIKKASNMDKIGFTHNYRDNTTLKCENNTSALKDETAGGRINTMKFLTDYKTNIKVIKSSHKHTAEVDLDRRMCSRTYSTTITSVLHEKVIPFNNSHAFEILQPVDFRKYNMNKHVKQKFITKSTYSVLAQSNVKPNINKSLKNKVNSRGNFGIKNKKIYFPCYGLQGYQPLNINLHLNNKDPEFNLNTHKSKVLNLNKTKIDKNENKNDPLLLNKVPRSLHMMYKDYEEKNLKTSLKTNSYGSTKSREISKFSNVKDRMQGQSNLSSDKRTSKLLSNTLKNGLGSIRIDKTDSSNINPKIFSHRCSDKTLDNVKDNYNLKKSRKSYKITENNDRLLKLEGKPACNSLAFNNLETKKDHRIAIDMDGLVGYMRKTRMSSNKEIEKSAKLSQNVTLTDIYKTNLGTEKKSFEKNIKNYQKRKTNYIPQFIDNINSSNTSNNNAFNEHFFINKQNHNKKWTTR